jgi:hypothetical protein
VTFRAALQLGFVLALNIILSWTVYFAFINSTLPLWARILCALLYGVPATVLAKGVQVVKE